MSIFNFAIWDTEGEAYKKHHRLKGTTRTPSCKRVKLKTQACEVCFNTFLLLLQACPALLPSQNGFEAQSLPFSRTTSLSYGFFPALGPRDTKRIMRLHSLGDTEKKGPAWFSVHQVHIEEVSHKNSCPPVCGFLP